MSVHRCIKLHLPRVTWQHPPYPGLAYFDRDDWPIYFGRETELQRLIGGRGNHFVLTDSRLLSWFYKAYVKWFLYADSEQKCMRIAVLCQKR